MVHEISLRDIPPAGPGKDGKIFISGSKQHTFQEHLRITPAAEVADFFSRVADVLDNEKGLVDYHLKVQNCMGRFTGWQVAVFYPHGGSAGQARSGPMVVDRCMSCDMECPLSIGLAGKDLGGPVSKDTIVFETDKTRCFLDAKARPLLVFNPVRHCARLSEMDRSEMLDFWTCVHRAFQDYKIRGFKSMVVNHGKNQNHAHLHLKMWLLDHEFAEVTRANPALHAMIGTLDEWVSTLPEEAQGPWRKRHGHNGNKRKAAEDLGGQKPPPDHRLQH